MSIYIKGMEMPDKCIKCKLMRRCGENDLDYVCMPARIYVEDLTNAYKPRPDYCPLVPVPDHGRLIDADALVTIIENCPDVLTVFDALHEVERMPAIIPADKESGE